MQAIMWCHLSLTKERPDTSCRSMWHHSKWSLDVSATTFVTQYLCYQICQDWHDSSYYTDVYICTDFALNNVCTLWCSSCPVSMCVLFFDFFKCISCASSLIPLRGIIQWQRPLILIVNDKEKSYILKCVERQLHLFIYKIFDYLSVFTGITRKPLYWDASCVIIKHHRFIIWLLIINNNDWINDNRRSQSFGLLFFPFFLVFQDIVPESELSASWRHDILLCVISPWTGCMFVHSLPFHCSWFSTFLLPDQFLWQCLPHVSRLTRMHTQYIPMW